MRNTIINVVYFLSAIIIQFVFFKYLSPYGISPNIILILVIYMGLVRGSIYGQLFGFILGLAWDVISVDLFGSYAFIYTCIGYLTGKISKKWDESKPETQIVLTFLGSLFLKFGLYILYNIFSYQNQIKLNLNISFFIQTLYTIVFAPIIFRIFIRLDTYFKTNFQKV